MCAYEHAYVHLQVYAYAYVYVWLCMDAYMFVSTCALMPVCTLQK